ncbi:hypothetical protein HS088_TW20G00675 [Tripterygium wilfordii]|uniref:Uncharacterized protein n=1 Tax=Tripterygium wilfordii TaxID=458696 RepID=A0A7J7C853_TRIWF|nr:hypothetical protein HS088_TW20G00675 [Tripterygium wilfordii]
MICVESSIYQAILCIQFSLFPFVLLLTIPFWLLVQLDECATNVHQIFVRTALCLVTTVQEVNLNIIFNFQMSNLLISVNMKIHAAEILMCAGGEVPNHSTPYDMLLARFCDRRHFGEDLGNMLRLVVFFAIAK